MEELIWFSIPGAVLAAALAGVWPSTIDSETEVLVWVVLTPVIGFIVHQFFRLIFEMTGSFSRRSRAVLDHISQIIAPRKNEVVTSRIRAFLIWEMTFYSENFPASFRDHDRGAWHYILSFWSITLSATISLVICLIGYFVITATSTVALIAVGEFLIAAIFYFKGRSTYQSLMLQEIAVTHTHEELFTNTIEALKDMK